jgi:hypothetical protein
MSRASLLNALRLVTALAVMLSAMPFLRGAAPSHDIGVIEVMADFGADRHTHAHSHDEDTDGATQPFHGHEYTDHSHVAFGLPAPPPVDMTGPEGRVVRIRDDHPRAAGLPYRVDHPPCVLSFA